MAYIRHALWHTVDMHWTHWDLQEETQEYLQEAKLKELVGKYSQFINFPIYLYGSTEVDVPVDEEDQTEADTDASEGAEDDVDDEDGELHSLSLQQSDKVCCFVHKCNGICLCGCAADMWHNMSLAVTKAHEGSHLSGSGTADSCAFVTAGDRLWCNCTASHTHLGSV